MFQLEKTLIPKPQQLENFHREIKIAEFMSPGFMLDVQCDGDLVRSGLHFLKEKLFDLALLQDFEHPENKYKITIRIDAECERFTNLDNKEAYCIIVDDDKTVVCGADEAGVLYGMITLSDLLHKEGSGVFLPKCEIIDFPDFSRRGHFMECRYGSEFMSKEDWFGVIDDMAKMKLNQLTIALYGCWKIQYDGVYAEYLYMNIEKYPFLKTYKRMKYYSVVNGKWIYKDNMLPSLFEDDFFGELVAYGKKKNVEVKPLFNSLGHNSLIPRMIPEVSAKDENGKSTGFGFCTQSEKTYEVMFHIYDEIIDRYLKPNGADSIEIGMDEVWDPYICHCEKCKDKPHPELMTEYIIKLCKYLKGKGMKHIYVYYDMLFHDFNILNEELKERFEKEGIYDEVVFDWWSYEARERLFLGREKDVHGLFRSVAKPFTGYYNWSTPTENNDNVRAVAAVAVKHNFEGIESYSSFEHSYDKNYLTVADVAWNTKEIENRADFNERYAYRYYPQNTGDALNAFDCIEEFMNKDNDFMNPLSSRFENYDYFIPGKFFPDVVYDMINQNEERDLSYLNYLRRNAKFAADFFENSGRIDKMNDIWIINTKHYYVTSDEYLTLHELEKRYHSGEADAFVVVNELNRLILQREKLMKLIELTRIPATAHTYLRNMSVYRQYMTDLRDYFKKELAEGRRPRLELAKLQTYVDSPERAFLR